MKFIFRLIVLVFATILISSCKEHKTYVLKVQLRELSPNDIYNIKDVEAVMFDKQELASDSIQKQSLELFLQGAEQYRNKNNPIAACVLFKKSILCMPQAKTYFELGNALATSLLDSRLKESLQAYKIAAELGYQPLNKVYYNQAIVHAKLAELPENMTNYNHYEIFDHLKMALTEGYADIDGIMSEPAFSKMKDSERFQMMLTSYMNKNEEGVDPMLLVFLKGFGPTQENFIIDTNVVNINEGLNSISYDFKTFVPEMQNMEFSRDVSHEYYYISKIKQTEKYTAVVHASVSFWEAMSPRTFTLAVYNNEGKRLSSLTVACNCDAKKVKTAKFKNGQIFIEDFAREWVYDTDEKSFDENVVKSYVSISTAVFEINEGGKIVEVKVPENYSDTVKFALDK